MFGIILILLTLAEVGLVQGAETPITPNASPESQALLTYLSDVYGKKIISGQQEGWRQEDGMAAELSYILKTTGKLPAMIGLDFTAYTRMDATVPNSHDLAKHAIEWYTQSNGIVSICWHWNAPLGKKAFYFKDTDFDLSRGVIDGTPEHAAILRDIDSISVELKLLRDAHVPVLWRPLHEANGRWFWWGAHGPGPLTKLWKIMFERMTVYHRLNNLIWVFSPGASIDLAEWYPGDEYVDFIGQDHYPMDGNNGPAKDVFNELVDFGRGTKLLGLSENGPIPDPDRLISEKAGWLFFTTWAGTMLTEKNSREQLIKVFHHPYVLNLGDLPELKRYPFAPAGNPTRLAFPARLEPVAISGLRRRPVTVAVEDRDGRIVRNRAVTVALAVAGNVGTDQPSGTLSTSTVNGIATFPDLKIHCVDKNCILVATAEGLQSAKSAPFQVGPGKGITQEWWVRSEPIPLSTLAGITSAPSGRRVVDKALEIPFQQTTNYGARYRGGLLPPQTGTYIFWIANHGASEFWLSTDSTPSKKKKIAEVTGKTPYAKWPHTNEAQSDPVILEAGQRYYLEILHQQNLGSAHLSVRWRLPDGTEQRPLPADRLTPFSEDEVASKPTE